MTHSRFNPYREWLGLERSPAHYYELLGLPLGETDVQRIGAAAARALSTLRSIRPGPRQSHWKALLDQLEAARDCLLTADLKVRYDQRLRRKLTADTEPLSAVPSVAPFTALADPMAPVEFAGRLPTSTDDNSRDPARTVSPPSLLKPDLHPASGPAAASAVAIDVAGPAAAATERERRHADVSLPSPSRAIRRRKGVSSRGSLTVAYTLMAVSFVGLLAAFVAVMQFWILPARAQRAQAQASLPQSASDLPLPIDAEAPPRPGDAAAQAVEAATPPATSAPQPPTVRHPPSTLPAASDDAATPSPAAKVATVSLPASTVEEINGLLREAFSATVDRQWPEATRLLEQASRSAGQTPLRARIERFATLNDYVQQYWQAFSDGLDDLRGSELELNGTRVFVVDVSQKDLVIRAQGQNKRYSRDDPPAQLMLAIADRWFDQRAATTHVFRGAFMLVSPTFSRDDARTAWQAAERSGAQLGDLPQILDDLEALEIGDPP